MRRIFFIVIAVVFVLWVASFFVSTIPSTIDSFQKGASGGDFAKLYTSFGFSGVLLMLTVVFMILGVVAKFLPVKGIRPAPNVDPSLRTAAPVKVQAPVRSTKATLLLVITICVLVFGGLGYGLYLVYR